MDMLRIVVIAALVCFASAVSGENDARDNAFVYNSAEYQRLLDDLWSVSTVANRHTPPFNENGTVVVSFGASLISTMEADIDSGKFEFLFWDKYGWKDGRMAWDPSAYGGITSVRIPTDMFWNPDIVTFNSLVSREEDKKSSVYAVIDHNGDILYIPPIARTIRCDTTADSHTASCKLKFGSWVYDGNMLALQLSEEGLDLSSYQTNGPAISNNHAEWEAKTYECCPETYPLITFNFDVTLAGGE